MDHFLNPFQRRDDVKSGSDQKEKLWPNQIAYMPSTPKWYSIPQFKELVRWPGCGSSGVLTEMPTEFDLDAYFYIKADNENKRALLTQAPAPKQQSGGKAIHWSPASVAKEEPGHEPQRVFKNLVVEAQRALRALNAKVSWTVQNLMPPYALDIPLWLDARAMDSVTADEASGHYMKIN